MSILRQLIHLAMVQIGILIFCGQVQSAFADFDCNTVSEIPILECEALVSLYNSAGGDSWSNNSDWLVSNTPCSWYGIGCVNGYVALIGLNSNQLNGTIPSELGNLSNLTNLWLQDNQLTGEIPLVLGNLSNLVDLKLDNNQLTSGIPTELGNLSNLINLSLANNPLSGSIPTQL